MHYAVNCHHISKLFRLAGAVVPTETSTGVVHSDRIENGYLVALRDISFELQDGDRLGIIGSNGAGKSTLLRILSGIIRPTTGTVEVTGRVTSVQEHSSLLFPELTGRENIMMMHRTMGLTSTDAKANLGVIDAFSGLGMMLDEPVKNYSSGMVLRLTMGIIHVIRPEILILDEALSAGDAMFRQQAAQQMDSLTQQARIMLFTSHQMQDISTHCNKCMVLHQGRITYFGNVNDAVTTYYGQAYNIAFGSDNRISNLEVALTPNRGEFTPDEAIDVTISFTLNAPMENLFPVLTVFGPHGPLLSDSPIYHPQPEAIYYPIGRHTCTVTLPQHTFNMGEFSLSVTLGDGEQIFIQINNAASFRILPGIWEQGKPWQTTDLNFPLRPKLLWKIATDSKN
jgi:lipopolysaccharide transport system ATP-binding protein